MPQSIYQRNGAIGARVRWSRTTDRRAATAPARAAFLARFEREVDPDGTLDPIVRATLAESAKKAYMLRLLKARWTRKRKRKLTA